MLVTDRNVAGGAEVLVRKVTEAIEGGVNAVQFRDKDLEETPRLALARRVKDAVAGRALLLVNGSLPIALAVGADGVHLPAYAPALEGVPAGMIVGRSVHSVASARRALRQGAAYLIAGSVFPTPSHEGRAPAGPSLIADILNVAAVPVVAIGGITADRVAEVMRSGASGIAVISAILGSPDARVAAARLRQSVQRESADTGA
jgi:thiamine-phosphate pyrophosphorylase